MRDPGRVDRHRRQAGLRPGTRRRSRTSARPLSPRSSTSLASAGPRASSCRGSCRTEPRRLRRATNSIFKAAFSGIPVAQGRPRRTRGLRRSARIPDRGRQSHRDQGAPAADGVPAQVRQLSAGKRSRQADVARNSMRSARRSRNISRCSTRTECGSRLGKEFGALDGDFDLGSLSPVAEAEVSCALRLRLA